MLRYTLSIVVDACNKLIPNFEGWISNHFDFKLIHLPYTYTDKTHAQTLYIAINKHKARALSSIVAFGYRSVI